MRQRNATWAIAGVWAVLVTSLIVFGCARSTGEAEGAAQEAEHHDGAATEQHDASVAAPAAHDNPAAEQSQAAAESRTAGREQAPEAEAPRKAEPGAAAEGSQEGAPSPGEAGQAAPSGKVVNGVRVVEVKARQFEFEPSTITVRQGEKVRLEVTSQDVTHGFGLVAFEINRPLPPGEMQKIEFTADKSGTFEFRCTIYCGRGHNGMKGELIVLPAP